jgi:hypothetical protein
MPDLTPNPASTINSSGVVGGLSFGYNQPLGFRVLGLPMFLGGEGFIWFGNSTGTVSGIPGTGGIATPAVMSNDNTTVRFGNEYGLLGKVGTVVTLFGSPIEIAFDGGIGFQNVNTTLNCTAAGACGTNGILSPGLTTSKTVTGSLIGGEVSIMLVNVPVVGMGASWLPGGRIGFQYLHGSFGNYTTTLGMPSQIQIAANQRVTTNNYMATLRIPIFQPH